MDPNHPSDRRARKKNKTRQAIVDTTLALFQKQGFENTTMEQIAEAADIAKGTLYNHFSSKEAIISEYMHYVIRDNQDRLERIINECSDTQTRLLTLLKTLAQWNDLNRDLVKMHATARLQDLFMFHSVNRPSNLEVILTRIITKGQETGELRKDFDAARLARYFKAMYLVPFIGWLAGEDSATGEQAIRETIEIFLNGVGMNGGAGHGKN